MAIYKIAEIDFDFTPKYKYTQILCKDYLSDEKYGIKISYTEKELLEEKEKAPQFTFDLCESTIIYRKICKEIIKHKGFVLHSSAIEKDGIAYLFTALSGVGKSTHARMWKEYFKDEVTIINDDKPIIRLINNSFYVFGTPWCGKDNLQTNKGVLVKAVCRIYQNNTNEIKEIIPSQILPFLLNQTLRPIEEDLMELLLENISLFLIRIKFYELRCNISYEAAKLAYEKMR